MSLYESKAKATTKKAIGVKVDSGDAALKMKLQDVLSLRVAVMVVGTSASFPLMTSLSENKKKQTLKVVLASA